MQQASQKLFERKERRCRLVLRYEYLLEESLCFIIVLLVLVVICGANMRSKIHWCFRVFIIIWKSIQYFRKIQKISLYQRKSQMPLENLETGAQNVRDQMNFAFSRAFLRFLTFWHLWGFFRDIFRNPRNSKKTLKNPKSTKQYTSCISSECFTHQKF